MAIEAYVRGRITRRKLDELGGLVDLGGLSQRLEEAGVGEEPAPVAEDCDGH